MFLWHALIQHRDCLNKNMSTPECVREVYLGLRTERGVDGVSMRLLLCSEVNGRC
jgi:hypothetical protein